MKLPLHNHNICFYINNYSNSRYLLNKTHEGPIKKQQAEKLKSHEMKEG